MGNRNLISTKAQGSEGLDIFCPFLNIFYKLDKAFHTAMTYVKLHLSMRSPSCSRP